MQNKSFKQYSCINNMVLMMHVPIHMFLLLLLTVPFLLQSVPILTHAFLCLNVANVSHFLCQRVTHVLFLSHKVTKRHVHVLAHVFLRLLHKNNNALLYHLKLVLNPFLHLHSLQLSQKTEKGAKVLCRHTVYYCGCCYFWAYHLFSCRFRRLS